MASMERPDWLLFLPHLPASPSSLRVLVWRRLRAAGAIGLQSGVWVLPHRPAHEQVLLELVREVERQGGTAAVFAAAPLDPALALRITEQSRADRDREYDEFRERCAALLAELDTESTGQKFTFAELEENEHELQKLTSWLAKIAARDFFDASGAAAARAAFAQCQRRLARYARTLYASEGLAPEDSDLDANARQTLPDLPDLPEPDAEPDGSGGDEE
jgi:ChrB-like protein